MTLLFSKQRCITCLKYKSSYILSKLVANPHDEWENVI